MLPITVVIASLGECTLLNTLESLNNGSKIPSEIIVVLPPNVNFSIKSAYHNVRIINCNNQGQVPQRLFGICLASNDYLMQLDDDIILDKDCLHRLWTALIERGNGSAVGPSLYDINTQIPIHRIDTSVGCFAKNLYYTLAYGARWGVERMGTIAASGITFGVDPEKTLNRIFKVNWLPGACVLGYRREFEHDQKYPFSGKAYYEDAIYSHYRSICGISQYVITDARAFIDEPTAMSYIDGFANSKIALKHFVTISHRSIIRYHIYVLFTSFRLAIARLKSKLL